MLRVYETVTSSELGSLKVAWQVPVASGMETAMADEPPGVWLKPGHETASDRYVEPDHVTVIRMAPVPVNEYGVDRSCGGCR
jgi:hypothetical protein